MERLGVNIMSIDYKQLETMVREAMFTGGGINEPSAPEGVPHRMPAADHGEKEQDMGDPKANKMYDVALAAREATEELVEALDDPVYDAAYEHAFKASACLRRVLNSLVESGAHPMPDQQVVAPPADMQKYAAQSGKAMGDYAGGAIIGTGFDGMGMEEQQDFSLGKGTVTKQAQAQGTRDRGSAIGKGDVLAGVDSRERAILVDIEKVLTQIADETNLVKYRPVLQTFIKKFMADVKRSEPTEPEPGEAV